MKFAVVLAALCTTVAAARHPHPSDYPVPSGGPEPGMEPITCTQKDHLNQICSKEGKVPIESSFRCCQWSGRCGVDSNGDDILKCTESRCCKYEGHPEPTKGPEPTDTPKPLPITTCGAAQEYKFTCPDDLIVNFPQQCCKHKDECGNLPKCSEEHCCMPADDLPEMVMNCTTKLEVEANKEDGYVAYECDEDDYMHVRTDGFLCCRWTAEEHTETSECLAFGAYEKCRESSCCVQKEMTCSKENSPKCVDGGRDILEGKPCNRWGEHKCDTYTTCCPQ